MRKIKQHNSLISFLKHNFFSAINVLAALTLLVISCLHDSKNFLLELKFNYSMEVTFAIFTSILILSIFKIFNYFHDNKSVKILDGYWIVSKFEEELYVVEAKAVIISRTADLKTMKMEMIDIESGEESNGLVFISENNSKIGKIYFKTGWLQDVFTNGPMCEYNYYVDIESFSSEFIYLIRIINQQGEEFLCLSKPKDQKRYFSKFKEAISSLNLKKGQNNISEVAERILNNN